TAEDQMHVYVSIRTPKYRRSLNQLFLGIAVLLLSLPCNSQTAGTGSIQGAISDPTGAIIPNASVAVTNTATQVKHTAVTGPDGLYSFPNLAIGTYNVEVAAGGFNHYRQ